MPLIKRGIEPVNLSRTHVAPGIQNELECVTNNTLANVIRQLSSLSKHAEDMFSELYRDTNSFFHRANQLQERVDRLKVKVTQLDSTVEEVSLQDINMRKPFKSSVLKDQQIVTLTTRPVAISHTYQLCDAPPALDKLDPYREDGKDSMKFYTDPQYFFELWCMEMQKDTELTKKELRKKKGKRGQDKKQTHIRQIQSKTQQMQRKKMGEEFVQDEPMSSKPISQDHYEHSRSPSRPNSLEIQNMEHLQQDGHYNNYSGGYGPGHYPQPAEQGRYSQANGPILRNTGQGEPGPQYQQPPPYTQGQQPPPYNMADYQAGMYNGSDHESMGLDGSPQLTPTRRGGTPSYRTPSQINSPARPTAAPPPPPGGSDPYSRSSSNSRELLPPPPPPPPEDVRNTPPYGSPQMPPRLSNLREDSPLRRTPSPANFPKSSTPDSIDLPPPPPPPVAINTPDSIDSMPPPPPTPPPPESMEPGGPPNIPVGPPPPPPPPPPSLAPPNGLGFKKNLPNGTVPQVGDTASLASNGSSATVSSGSVKNEAVEGGIEKAPVRDNRSDLLQAIRTGFQLRRVEERRQKQEDRRPTGRLDVQSIMEAAFEMRRKALEANDSESSDESEENEAWDSDE